MSDQPAKCDRIISIGRCGLTKSGDQGKSNHHCRSEPPAGHSPRFPCSPIIILATCGSAISGRVTKPCQLHHPVGFAGGAPTTSRTTECKPSAPINTSPSAELPSSKSTRTPLPLSTTRVARELQRMRSAGKPLSSRSSRIRRGSIRIGAPSRFTIASRSIVASGRPVDVMTRTADSSCPAPSISTPSWSRTVAPLDQIVTAPPPAVAFGR